MLNAIAEHLIYAAPPPTYTAANLEGLLCWLPWNDMIPRPCPANAPPDAPPKETPPVWLPCLWLQAREAATIVLYFHANAEDLGLVHAPLRHLHEHLQVSVLAVEYPGYGLLKHLRPSEEAICSAALVALRYLVDEVGVSYSQIVLLGRSLGGGPAVYLASRFPVGGLILVNTFTSLKAAAVAHVGSMIANAAVRDAFLNERAIANVSCPTLFIHARQDQTVPVDHSVRLFERCRSRKLLVTPERMDHNSHLFADAAFLALPAIHFFHFPGYQTERPPRMPEQLFVEPSVVEPAAPPSPKSPKESLSKTPSRSQQSNPSKATCGSRNASCQEWPFMRWFCGSSSAGGGVAMAQDNGDIDVSPSEAPLGAVYAGAPITPGRSDLPSGRMRMHTDDCRVNAMESRDPHAVRAEATEKPSQSWTEEPRSVL
eukprot:gnl/TRDRNA2_/TRDRNA2_36486_c0_seq1.p1 gnl/TRDRNA2_/TRDRNA2_36486_c0~~gnl/TRDRNA2_/TRDRNA2_36486_c0_seq1.p1  ORF type:complete len:428 (+),score=65.86 gnl/TRDRNA2_/TRDRNA2_36486_c0_seq1:58-1341(+)